eukprot:GGOE01012679.1.p1 GENE.GGOE01012679.1~~GGOE01012679.1.p1  ORF type:complete len:444 (-),score=100.42 GGOE01012679.1:1072-2403(-)
MLLFGLLGWWLAHRHHRDHTTAPKNNGEPFCILFTDIQASTYLWATVPEVMVDALYVHHALIRKLLLKHHLYEVKTIGDSFMCAARSPTNAVGFALDLQRELFECDWGTDRIDTTYLVHQNAEKGKWVASHECWNGLRVRVGIHHGLGEVYLDPVTRGYDYYGTVVNTAARVEAVCHGGQVGITQAVYDALKGEFPGAVVTDLGEQALRGLAEPVHLHQLVPMELSARSFPPLRLDHAATVETMGHPTSDCMSARVSQSRSAVVPISDRNSVFGRMSPTTRDGSSMGRGTSPRGCASPTASTALSAALGSWVESHPLVRSGQLSAEDLTIRYLTVQKAFSTLLETQTQRVRESSLRAYCERLHVRYVGSEEARLEETLNGIVQRVLPAALSTVMNAVIRRANSMGQDGSLELLSPMSCDVRGVCDQLSSVHETPMEAEEMSPR